MAAVQLHKAIIFGSLMLSKS